MELLAALQTPRAKGALVIGCASRFGICVHVAHTQPVQKTVPLVQCLWVFPVDQNRFKQWPSAVAHQTFVHALTKTTKLGVLAIPQREYAITNTRPAALNASAQISPRKEQRLVRWLAFPIGAHHEQCLLVLAQCVGIDLVHGQNGHLHLAVQTMGTLSRNPLGGAALARVAHQHSITTGGRQRRRLRAATSAPPDYRTKDAVTIGRAHV